MDIYNGWANFMFAVKFFLIGFPVVYAMLICGIAFYRSRKHER